MFLSTLDEIPNKWYNIEESFGHTLNWYDIKENFIQVFKFTLEEKHLREEVKHIIYFF
jgi:hypothetical protein